MKLILALALIALLSNDPLKVTKINRAKTQAREAFNSGDYQTAIAKYRYLVDSLQVTDDAVTLNLANAYYLSKDTANAFQTYERLSGSPDKKVNSRANQQLGVMSNKRGKPEDALRYFKQAIKSDPFNDDARYNYEMLKKKLDGQKQKDEDQKKDDKNKQDQQNQEPSEFARKLKEQADKLVAQRQYNAAYELMIEGLKKDKTVGTYQDYINRIKEVADINK
ncbi:MAG TPA: tetratricopeptide repeat protein [Chryseosolibacter sp.]|nr:tetratricopeptide repeat protein [Chryseosolibacter sp.]